MDKVREEYRAAKALLDKSYDLVLKGFARKKQRELLGISCCGTECGKCDLHGRMCEGCNEASGKVFHAPKGKACPIYACCAGKRRMATCADCGEVPCDIWRTTRDPALSDAAFKASIQARVRNLKGS